MISPNALSAGLPSLLNATTKPITPAPSVTANPFQLDVSSPLGASSVLSNSTSPSSSVLNTIASIGQVISLLAVTAATPTPLINGNGAGLGVNGAGGKGAGNGAINTTTDPTQRARLDNALSGMANDPEGSKLLEAAIAKGYTIEVGDPSAATGSRDAGGAHDVAACPECQAALDGGQQVNGVTLPGQKKIVINPNAPDFEKTLAHELVHAASEGDGNSVQEEGVADVVGFRIAGRLTGNVNPLSEAEIAKQKEASYTVATAGGQARNGIIETLAQLGIRAFQ